MKFKIVPPARGLETLRAVHRSVPIVPDSVDDCCVRVCQRTAVPGRDEAREWLTFCRALGLVEATDAGYRRIREDPELAALGEAFRTRIYGADAVLTVVTGAEHPVPVERVGEAVAVPAWERHHHQDAETVWSERVARPLEWAVAFELLDRVDGGYRG